jgi:enoyl-CoA hydratase/carnithine racemase
VHFWKSARPSSQDDEIRAVILTGAGRVFCSGGDISKDFQYPIYRGHRLESLLLKFGLIPDEGGAYLFPKFMGPERALKMSLFSEVYTAQQAKDLGLVTEPDAELMLSQVQRQVDPVSSVPKIAT